MYSGLKEHPYRMKYFLRAWRLNIALQHRTENQLSYNNLRSWIGHSCTHAKTQTHTKTELVFYWLRNALKVIASGQSSQINCFLASLKETTSSPSVIKCELLTPGPMTFRYKNKVLKILRKLIVFAALCKRKMSLLNFRFATEHL